MVFSALKYDFRIWPFQMQFWFFQMQRKVNNFKQGLQ